MPVSVPVLAVGALLLGGAAGVAAESAGFSPIPEPDADEEVVEAGGVVAGPAVSVFDCPDGVPIAALAGGDGVVATGRTEDGVWIEIRSPLDVTTPAWMTAGALDPDGDLDALPVHECGVEATTTTTVPGATTTSSTTTTSTSTTTSTTVPGETTTTGPRPTTPPPTQPTTPPPPPDTEAPRISRPAAIPSQIVTAQQVGGDFCPAPNPPGTPTTAFITATITDDRPGAITVTMRYVTRAPNGTIVSQGGALPPVTAHANSVFRGRLGPLDPNESTAGAGVRAEITIRAVDAAGNAREVVLNQPTVLRCPP